MKSNIMIKGKTYIEFFDRRYVENICSSIINPPARVILIGDNHRVLNRHANVYRNILLKRGYEVEFICKTVNKNSLQNIVETISDIIDTYEECYLDLTGGDDLCLVGAGIVFERHKENGHIIQMHRFNIRNGVLYDCDMDGTTIMGSTPPAITIEENIKVYGGAIKNDGTRRWNIDQEFMEDVDLMWNICKENVRGWNVQINELSKAERTKEHLNIVAKNIHGDTILGRLRKAGLLEITPCGDGTFAISYKNPEIKKCLTNPGMALELIIFCAALNACDDKGNKIYNDVLNGVTIDWDGEVEEKPGICSTENEIDVIMMHGLNPVFVSCKNGQIDKEELYKLNVVTDRFGGRYAKKVLVAPAIDELKDADAIRQRAKDMNIRIIGSIEDLNAGRIEKMISTLWLGK